MTVKPKAQLIKIKDKKLKKNKFFMPFNERKTVVESLSMVDSVINFKDDDIGSCSDALEKIKKN